MSSHPVRVERKAPRSVSWRPVFSSCFLDLISGHRLIHSRERERLFGTAVEQSGLSNFTQILSRVVFSSLMDPCRYGAACWRPLCPYVHVCSRTRARRWTELWSFLALQEEAVEEHIVDVPGPQIAAKIPEVVETKIHEEIVDSVQTIPRIVPQAHLVHL